MNSAKLPDTLQAVTRRKAGGPQVLRVEEIPMPFCGPKDVLVRVHAATVTRGDAIMLGLPRLVWGLMRIMGGFKSKKVLGTEYSGEIVALGNEVSKFSLGDEVFGLTTMESMGGQAQYTKVSADGIIARKPKKLDHSQSAALIVGAMTALQLLEKGDIESRTRVMIYGASGSVGSYAVQLAKHYGKFVTGVCSMNNIDFVKSLGADQVVDYTSPSFEEHEDQYDFIFDAVNKLSRKDKKKFLASGGKYISSMSMTKELVSDMERIAKLADDGVLNPQIEKTYKLDEIQEAYTLVKSGRKQGNIVIDLL